MSKDQLIGGLILVGSIVGIIAYGWLLYVYSVLVLQITALLVVGAMLGGVPWIGWTMATTPPPAPLETETKSVGADGSTISSEQKWAMLQSRIEDS